MAEYADPKKIVDGLWYWVSKDGGKWWPAKRDSQSAGGWTNDDTWEDFSREVKFYALIRTLRQEDIRAIPNTGEESCARK